MAEKPEGKGTEETKIIFADDEQIRKRREKFRKRYQDPAFRFLLGDEYEQCRGIYTLMYQEGRSEEFMKTVICDLTDEAYALTLDYIHSAALIMGEDYVRKHLLGQTRQAEEASKNVREYEYEQKTQALRKEYDSLDERLRAAREKEKKADIEIKVLELQSSHAKELYKQRMDTARMQSSYEKKLMEIRAQHQKERDQAEIGLLKTEVDRCRKQISLLEEKKKEQERKLAYALNQLEVLQKESGSDSRKKHFLFRFCPSTPDDAQKPGSVQETGRSREAASAGNTLKEMNAEDEQRKKERKDFCLSVLANSEFSEEQIELIFRCLTDPRLSLNALRYICNPKLPPCSMRAIIRYLSMDEGRGHLRADEDSKGAGISSRNNGDSKGAGINSRNNGSWTKGGSPDYAGDDQNRI